MRNPFLLTFTLFISVAVSAQQPEKKPATTSDPAQTEAPKKDDKQPQVRYNMINVCSPDEADRHVLSAAMAKVPRNADFAPDFELTRGVVTMKDAKPARYLRLRREMKDESSFGAALYSLSTDPDTMTETLVLKSRDTKDFVSLSLDASVSAGVSSPSTMLGVDTPPSRLRVERSGKASVVLARCDSGGQDIYEPLFKEAATLMSLWRKSLGLRGAFQADIAWLTGSPKSATAKKPATKPSPAPNIKPSDKAAAPVK